MKSIALCSSLKHETLAYFMARNFGISHDKVDFGSMRAMAYILEAGRDGL